MQVTLVLGETPAGRARIRAVFAALSMFYSGLLLLAALAPPAQSALLAIYRVEEGSKTAELVRTMLLLMVGVPPLEAGRRYLAGLLGAAKRTAWITAGAVANIGATAAAVVLLLRFEFTSALGVSTAWLPMIGVYAGYAADIALLVAGVAHSVDLEAMVDRPEAAPVGYGGILAFSWPLLLRETAMGLSRPMVNLWTARSADGAVELAVLTITFPFVHTCYGWLNELKNLAPAFKHQPAEFAAIRQFYILIFGLSQLLMAGLTLTPLSTILLTNATGIPLSLALRCKPTLRLFMLWPAAVAVRSYWTGEALVERRTSALAAAGPLRVLSIALMLVAVPWAAPGLGGAVAGTVALCSGFCPGPPGAFKRP
jgi:hypothetical protein